MISYISASSVLQANPGQSIASGSYNNPGGDDVVMLIDVINYSGVDDVAAPTFNGVAATLIAKKGFNTLSSPQNWIYTYRLANPAVGSHTLSVSRSNTTSYMAVVARTYSGVNQDTPIDAYAVGGTDDAASVETQITTLINNSWVAINAGSQRALSAGSGVTARASWGNDQFLVGDSNGPISPAGLTSMTINIGGTSGRTTGVIMVALKPVDLAYNPAVGRRKILI